MKQLKMPKNRGSVDKLVPLINKIQEVSDNVDKYFDSYPNISFEIDLLNGVTVKIDKERIFMQTAFGEGQLQDAIYNGCEAFVQWFNENKK